MLAVPDKDAEVEAKRLPRPLEMRDMKVTAPPQRVMLAVPAELLAHIIFFWQILGKNLVSAGIARFDIPCRGCVVV